MGSVARLHHVVVAALVGLVPALDARNVRVHVVAEEEGLADADLPAAYRAAPSRDLEGRVVTPGLIDCHTHIVYGGDRAREFEMRLEGAAYEEIARAGGGIVSSS